MEGAASGFAVLFTLIGLIWGLICLISPRAARLPSRWYSIPLLLSLCLFFGLAMIAYPTSTGSETPPSEMMSAGISFVVVWLFLAGICHMVARQMPRIRAAAKEVQETSSTDVIDIERDFNARRAAEALIRRNTEQRAWPDYDHDEDYEPAPPRNRRKRITPKVQGDKENIPSAKAGTWIEFTYVDSEGEITERHLRNWSRTSQYLEGFCMDRKASRTFRVDRVIQWRAWES